MTTEPLARSGRAARAGFVTGFVLAVGLLAALGELFLRRFPPQDLHPYLGEASPTAGPFAPHNDFGVGYRSWEVFCADNAERLRAFGPFRGAADARPTWAFFGNSFVQADGMLADHARARVPDRRVFNLGRNEHLGVRLAQVEALLEHGLAPERIFVALMPLDTAPVGRQPLDTVHVTARGALTYRPRTPPGPAGALVSHSRLALTGWLRSGRHQGNPSFHPKHLNRGLGEPLRSDLERLFGGLARVARRYRVPVTFLLIPTYEQVMSGAPCGFQDDLVPLLRGQGHDVLDLRDAFRDQPDRAALFLPDKHFTPRGNEVLLAALLRHVRANESDPSPGVEVSRR